MKITKSLHNLNILLSLGTKVGALRTPAASIPSRNELQYVRTDDAPSMRPDSMASVLEIGRGGSLPTLDAKTFMTMVLGCMAAQGVVEIAFPAKVINFYGYDEKATLNPFYVSQVGALVLNTVLYLLLQLYANIGLVKAVGYSCLPLTAMTVYQLAAGRYAKVRCHYYYHCP